MRCLLCFALLCDTARLTMKVYATQPCCAKSRDVFLSPARCAYLIPDAKKRSFPTSATSNCRIHFELKKTSNTIPNPHIPTRIKDTHTDTHTHTQTHTGVWRVCNKPQSPHPHKNATTLASLSLDGEDVARWQLICLGPRRQPAQMCKQLHVRVGRSPTVNCCVHAIHNARRWTYSPGLWPKGVLDLQ